MAKKSIALLFTMSSFSLSFTDPARYRFDYKVKIQAPQNGVQVQVWIPFPYEGISQKVHAYHIQSILPWRLLEERKYGNRILFFEGIVPSAGTEIVATYDISRWHSSGMSSGKIKIGSQEDPQKFVNPDKFVPLNATIKSIAIQET